MTLLPLASTQARNLSSSGSSQTGSLSLAGLYTFACSMTKFRIGFKSIAGRSSQGFLQRADTRPEFPVTPPAQTHPIATPGGFGRQVRCKRHLRRTHWCPSRPSNPARFSFMTPRFCNCRPDIRWSQPRLLCLPARLFDQGVKLVHVGGSDPLENDNIFIADYEELCAFFQVKALANGLGNHDLS